MEREPFTEDTGINETEKRARDVGWVSEDEFKGDKSKWRDAEAFLDYADHVTPVLKKNNQKLFEDLRQRDEAINSLQETVNEQAKILKALTDSAAEEIVAKTETKLEDLRASLVEANRNGDAELAASIQEDIVDFKIALKEKQYTSPVDLSKPDNKQPAMNADEKATWDEWVADNEWYADPVYAAAATAMGSSIIKEAMENGEPVPKGKKLLDTITKRMDNKFNIFKTKGSDKVDGGADGGMATGSKGGKRFHSLPTAARDACNAQAKKFVGSGKRYQKLEDWQKRFTEIYYSDEA